MADKDFVGVDVEKVWFKKMMEIISLDPREFGSFYEVYYEGMKIDRTQDPEEWKDDNGR